MNGSGGQGRGVEKSPLSHSPFDPHAQRNLPAHLRPHLCSHLITDLPAHLPSTSVHTSPRTSVIFADTPPPTPPHTSPWQERLRFAELSHARHPLVLPSHPLTFKKNTRSGGAAPKPPDPGAVALRPLPIGSRTPRAPARCQSGDQAPPNPLPTKKTHPSKTTPPEHAPPMIGTATPCTSTPRAPTQCRASEAGRLDEARCRGEGCEPAPRQRKHGPRNGEGDREARTTGRCGSGR